MLESPVWFAPELCVCCALEPVVGFSFAVRDGQDDNLFAVQLIDNRIGKFSNDEASPFAIELRPAQRIVKN